MLSRRRILSGLIAAPAVLVLGAHMPVRVWKEPVVITFTPGIQNNWPTFEELLQLIKADLEKAFGIPALMLGGPLNELAQIQARVMYDTHAAMRSLVEVASVSFQEAENAGHLPNQR